MFFATIPAATEFYHGTPSEYRVNDTEWLSFEPEHALWFANYQGPGNGPPPPPPSSLSEDHMPANHPGNADQDYRFVNQGDDRAKIHATERDSPVNADGPHGGYLHTYRTKRTLRLLYLDGQSAAKSRKGTLDVQDVILRDPGTKADLPSEDPGHHAGGVSEQLRAKELCHRAEAEWEGKIDGILRMEAGFEVILCSFKDNLDLLSIKQELPREGRTHLRDPRDYWNYYQAVAARFDGIGGHRVSLDLDRFVSVYTYANATEIDPEGLPRVVNDTAIIKRIRSDVTEMLTLPRTSPTAENIDWQAVTDMIVARYGHRIASLASKSATTLDALHTGLDYALRPFIDYSNRNATEEVARCSTQFLSPEAKASNSTAAIAVKTTYTHICQSLSDALMAETFDKAAILVRNMKNWLAWSTWKRCTGCQVDEVCVVPIWPWGSKPDFEHPSCSNMTSTPSNDYWGPPRG